MKMKYLIFALLTVASASSFTGCNESTPDPKTPQDCVTCEDEHTISEITDYEAVVITFFHGEQYGVDSISYGLTIEKENIDKENIYSYSDDSVFVTCPSIPKELQVFGTKVTISGAIKSCNNLLTHPNVHTIYGRKFDLKNIKKR